MLWHTSNPLSIKLYPKHMHILVVCDLESTGLSPHDDAVTEFAAAIVEGDSFELERGQGG